jgi:hypothetical protein
MWVSRCINIKSIQKVFAVYKKIIFFKVILMFLLLVWHKFLKADMHFTLILDADVCEVTTVE